MENRFRWFRFLDFLLRFVYIQFIIFRNLIDYNFFTILLSFIVMILIRNYFIKINLDFFLEYQKSIFLILLIYINK